MMVLGLEKEIKSKTSAWNHNISKLTDYNILQSSDNAAELCVYSS